MSGPDDLWGDEDLPELPEIDHTRVWWTWNMALAWIIWRRKEPVEFVALHWNDAFALGKALLKSEFMNLARSYGYGKNEPDPAHRATQALIDKIKQGAVQASGRPVACGTARPASTIEPYQFENLKFVPGPQGREALVYTGASGASPPLSNLEVHGFLEPRLKAVDVRKAFPAGGNRLRNDQQLEAAIAFLMTHLKAHPERLTKLEYQQLLVDNGFRISPNAFARKVWRAALTESGRDDLRKPGPR
ncbi:MAG: hypothetical protein H6884_00675 [Rhodobiaceae bacterium]|nr:hypothetical protein [Rhodobiaceae bacterium]